MVRTAGRHYLRKPSGIEPPDASTSISILIIKTDLDAGKIDYDTALELVECLWLKYSEWAWTISANTADFFAGYTNFENLTVGGTHKGRQGRHK